MVYVHYGMKKILIISLALYATFSFGQSPPADSFSVVLDYAFVNIGKKVGKGVCMELVINAENEKYDDWYGKYWNIDSLAKHQVYLDSVVAGDVVVLVNCVMGEDTIPMDHIGIVWKVVGREVWYLSQNIGEGRNKKVKWLGEKIDVLRRSRVRDGTIYVDKIVSGNVFFFHF